MARVRQWSRLLQIIGWSLRLRWSRRKDCRRRYRQRIVDALWRRWNDRHPGQEIGEIRVIAALWLGAALLARARTSTYRHRHRYLAGIWGQDAVLAAWLAWHWAALPVLPYVVGHDAAPPSTL